MDNMRPAHDSGVQVDGRSSETERPSVHEAASPTGRGRLVRVACWLLLGVLLAVSGHPSSASTRKRVRLEPRYEHWLHDEVNYVITKEEEAEFRGMPNDPARDNFIQHFWSIRNPDPNAPTNEAHDELYRRLAYAQEHFGALNFNDGVHSDRGMVYITLGPPQQREVHPEAPHLRPIEIWFYQNTVGGLPTHFYVLFYRPDPGADFRLYSPYGDRPEKLVNGSDAVNNDKAALHFIANALGAEAEHVALSLLPTEPVNVRDPTISLQSDVLLNQIREYRNLASTKRALALRRAQTEGVSHRLLLGSEFSDLTVIATRDSAQQASVHYLFSLRSPQDFGFGQRVAGGHFYSLHLKCELIDASGKVVKTEEHDLSGDVNEKQLTELKSKAFNVEGRLPVAPGSYDLKLELTNNITRQAFTQDRKILVPGASESLALSQAFFANALPPVVDSSREQPFSFSGVKLSPRGGDNVIIPAGAPLRIIFQLWERPADPAAARGAVELHYLVGRVSGIEKHEEDQTVERSQFDSDGNLLMGRDFSTSDLSEGSYRLVIKATDLMSGQTSYQALNFILAGTDSPPPSRWTVIVPPERAQSATASLRP